MTFKRAFFEILDKNRCLDLIHDPFKNIDEVLFKLTHDSDEIYRKIIECIRQRSYLSDELGDRIDEILKIKNMSYEDGLKHIKQIYFDINGMLEENEYNYLVTYIGIYIYANGYPRLQLEPYDTCHCPIYREDIQRIIKELNEMPDDALKTEADEIKFMDKWGKTYVWGDETNEFTRSMQTLFTIHALIYDKKDVEQWWNNLSEHCKNTFKQELNIILDNDLQHEYIATTRYFDEFMKVYNTL